jgi:hypothetical protein
MALQRTALGERIASHRELISVLIVIALGIALMFAANAIFGLHGAGPAYDIVPDPAGGFGLP